MERRGVPTSTVITTAFLNHARHAAKNLHIDDLPLLVLPHPVYDLPPEQLREIARMAYPLIIEQLTGRGVLAKVSSVDFVLPTERNPQPAEINSREEIR
jgi:hypothetical protein